VPVLSNRTQSLAQASTGKTKSEERELRAMKMNKKESAMRKYFWEKFYLPNHYFYKHSDTIQLVKQLFLFSSWT